MYREPTFQDSNPHRERKRENPRSFVGTILFVYVPTILAVSLARAFMLITGHRIINIPVFDDYCMKLGRMIANLFQ